MTQQRKQLDAIIIGAGFYGLRVALFLYEELGIKNILILERENGSMKRASYVNQARVHNGYHYPRSVLTAYRSAVNFPRFVEEYQDAVVSDFDKHYAIAKHLSKVNARQFKAFCEKIGSPVQQASPEITSIFEPNLIEEVFKVKEYAFDAIKLRDMLLKRLQRYPSIVLQTGESVNKIAKVEAGIQITTDRSEYVAASVLNCTYSGINTLHRYSDIPLVSLKQEVTEMCLIKLPDSLKDFSVTVMDGPFFSIMPFPSKGLHSLSHVRYTPHESWADDAATSNDKIPTYDYLQKRPFVTNFPYMYSDVIRFIPALKDMQYIESITEVKTVLTKSEDNDSRPILYRDDLGIPGYVCILGGKMDNIYDVFEELRRTYGQE